MGRVTQLACVQCGRVRDVAAADQLDAMRSTVIPLTRTRLRHAVLGHDLVTLQRQHASAARPVTAEQAIKQYVDAGGTAPPEQSLRPILQAMNVVSCTAELALKGWALQCIPCGLDMKRGFIDANAKATRQDTKGSPGVAVEYEVPLDIMQPGHVGLEIEAASVAAAAEARRHGYVDSHECGSSYHKAACAGTGTKVPLAATGLCVLSCVHQSIVAAVAMSRGEVHSLHVFMLLLSVLMCCRGVKLDVWCSVLSHIRAQSRHNAGFAERLLRAVLGERGSAASARLSTLPLGSGPAPAVRVSVQCSEEQQRAWEKASAEATWQFILEMENVNELERNEALHRHRAGERVVRLDAPEPACLPAAPSGAAGFAELLQDTFFDRPAGVACDFVGSIPAWHAKVHACKATHGDPVVPESGHRGEAIEQLFAPVSAYAPYLRSMSETQWRLAWSAFAGRNNCTRNRGAPQRLLEDFVRFTAKAHQARINYAAAVVDYAVKQGSGEPHPTESQVRQWAAEASCRDEKAERKAFGSQGAAGIAAATALVRQRSEFDALDSVLESAASVYDADASNAAVASVNDEDDVRRSEACFQVALSSAPGVAAMLRRRLRKGELPVTDIASARVRLTVMQSRIDALMEVLRAAPAIQVDDLIVEHMGNLFKHAKTVGQLLPTPGMSPAACEYPGRYCGHSHQGHPCAAIACTVDRPTHPHMSLLWYPVQWNTRNHRGSASPSQSFVSR